MKYIVLTKTEQELAFKEGNKRHFEAQAFGQKDQHGKVRAGDNDELNLDIQASGAEIAVAKFLGQPWNGHKGIGVTDVGHDVEVRWSSYQQAHLLVHNDDPVYKLFYLVTGKMPAYSILGWIDGFRAKTSEHLKDIGNGREPCYWIKQEDLTGV